MKVIIHESQIATVGHFWLVELSIVEKIREVQIAPNQMNKTGQYRTLHGPSFYSSGYALKTASKYDLHNIYKILP